MDIVPTSVPLNFRVRVPGSKSVANRALICAALADGPSTIRNVPDGDDTSAMIDALVQLGIGVSVDAVDGNRVVHVTSSMDRDATSEVRLDARLAGTTSRFLAALAALRSGPTVVDGAPSLRSRPIGDLLDALTALGVEVELLSGERSLPVRVRRGALTGGTINVTGSVSSQFISALSMIGPLLPGGLSIGVDGSLVSASYVRLTIETMATFGVQAMVSDGHVECPESSYVGCVFDVPPDASSATYPAAAVAIAGGEVCLLDLRRSSSQPDSAFPRLLERMGCRLEDDGRNVVIARERHTALRGITVDMRDMSDSVPALVAVATCAETPTTITGVGFIRGKESDRLGDLAAELSRLGARVEERSDGLRIDPVPLHGGTLDTHHDHRLAMAFAVLGLGVPGVSVRDPSVVSKSWPSFWSELRTWSTE